MRRKYIFTWELQGILESNGRLRVSLVYGNEFLTDAVEDCGSYVTFEVSEKQYIANGLLRVVSFDCF